MIGPADEYPIHQIAQPIAWPGTSDRNFYDRYYHNLMNRSGDLMLVTGMGFYPNLGTKDAFVVIRRGDRQIGVNLSGTLDQDRLHPNVGNYRIEVVEPLRSLRLILEETEGFAFDIEWRATFPVVQETPHIMRRGNRPILDAQRFSQMGTYTGTIALDGEELTIDPAHWFGFRDRSWGIRPVGEPEPPGAPVDFNGTWLFFLALAFDDYAVSALIQEDSEGHRFHNDCVRIDAAETIEQLGWPEVSVDYIEGSRYPARATLTATLRGGVPLRIDVEALTGAPSHLGGGYGGASTWSHGMWMGDKFIRRVDFDLTDEEVKPLITFGSIDHTVRAVCRIDDDICDEGWGLMTHATLGPHRPSGFTSWDS